jgi:type I restriction enzyme, S subunit
MKTVAGWETKRFDEFGTIFSGSTPSTSIESFWDGEIVWITPYDLSRLNTPYLSDSSKRITEKGLNGCSAHLLPAGSVVMSSRAPIGYVALPTVPFCTNQGCKTIKLKNGFHSVFAYYNVLFNIDKVKNLGEGTTFAEISKAALSTVELAFPKSLSEQTKIAEILSTVDRAIEQTEALIAKQQRTKTGLMQDLLTRGIDEHGNLRSERTHQFKDSSLGRIPVEWEDTDFGQIFAKYGGHVQTGPFGSQLHSYEYVSEGIPVVMPQDIPGSQISTAEIARITEQKAKTHWLGTGSFPEIWCSRDVAVFLDVLSFKRTTEDGCAELVVCSCDRPLVHCRLAGQLKFIDSPRLRFRLQFMLLDQPCLISIPASL